MRLKRTVTLVLGLGLVAVLLGATPPAAPAAPPAATPQPAPQPATAKPAPGKPAPSPIAPEKPGAAAKSWRFVGTFGRGLGTLRFRVRGARISHATAEAQGVPFAFRSSPVEKGEFTLVGNREGDFLKLDGKLRRGERWVSGTFSGAIKRKKIRGTFTASRR